MSASSSCPGDCCRLIRLGPGVYEENADARSRNVEHFTDGETVFQHFWPNGTEQDTLECDGFDRATRRCMIYDKRPQLCRDYPNYTENKPCENCTYDKRQPDWPGVRYAAIEDSGVFAHDNQPRMEERLERMR